MKQTMINKNVTYKLEVNGKLFIIENVSVRVCRETGETFFVPTMIEHIQRVVHDGSRPVRTAETPIFEYV